MGKLKLVGIGVAVLVLIFALIAKNVGTDSAAMYMLPVLAAMVIALFAVDLIAFKKEKSASGAVRITELIRVIMLAVTAIILIAATVLVFVF